MPQACLKLQSTTEAFSVPEEVWWPCSLRPDYQVSNLGRIKGPRGIRNLSDTKGYLYTGIILKGKRVNMLVHIEVCKAFHKDTWFEGAWALHRDSNRKNNHEGNLYWGTQRQNEDDKIAFGSAASKLTGSQVEDIRRRFASGERNRDLSREYGVSRSYISNLVHMRFRETTNA